MIDPSFADITDQELAEGNPFMHPYPPTVKELEEKIADLENKLSMKTQQWEYAGEALRNHAAQISRFEDALKHNEWDFDSDTLESLADFFSIELNREYDVTITVRWSGTVTAPMNFDIDDLENFLDIRIDTDYRTSDATIDLYQDDFEIDYTEA